MSLVTKVSHWVSVNYRHSPTRNDLYIDDSGYLGEYGEYVLKNSIWILNSYPYDSSVRRYSQQSQYRKAGL